MPSVSPLSSSQLRTLHRALLTEFKDREQEFEDLLRVRIGAPLDRLVSPGPLSGKIFEVIQVAERAAWTPDLVRAAADARPASHELAELSRELGLASDLNLQHAGAHSSAPLEAVIALDERGAGSLFDIGRWRERLALIEARVCRVEAGGSPRGTGFLVGADLVLTAYHNVDDLVKAPEIAHGARLRFDYRVVAGIVTEGVIVELHPTDWLVDHSTTSASAMSDPPETSGPAGRNQDTLDYALLRLARPIGGEPVDMGGHGSTRGWLRLPESPPPIVVGMHVSIAQYALGGPLKIAVDSAGVLGVNKTGTLVRYATMTEPGSGGAPCFNAEWDVFAMHLGAKHGADGSREFGVGVTIAAILSRMKQRGTLSALRSEPSGPTDRPGPGAPTPVPTPPPVVDKEDPQRGRWGGLPERNGRAVKAQITNVDRSVFTFNITVASTDGSTLEGPVLFHLHDTFSPSVIRVRKIRDNQEATLWDVTSYGVFTVGVQVKDRSGDWVGLELDIATLSDLPDRFRSR